MMTFEEIISHQLFQDVLRFPLIDEADIRDMYDLRANNDGHKHWVNHPVTFFKVCMLSSLFTEPGKNCFKFVLSLNHQNVAIELDKVFAPWSNRNREVAYQLLQEKF